LLNPSQVLHLPWIKTLREKPAVERAVAFYNDRALYYAIPRAMVMIYFFNLYAQNPLILLLTR
jgi:hypothetical protein